MLLTFSTVYYMDFRYTGKMTNTTGTNTLIIPEMTEEITADHTSIINLATEERNRSVEQDRILLERFRITNEDLRKAGLPSVSKETAYLDLKLSTLVFLAKFFTDTLDAGEVFVEYELEFHARHIANQQEVAPNFPGIIDAHKALAEVLKTHL